MLSTSRLGSQTSSAGRTPATAGTAAAPCQGAVPADGGGLRRWPGGPRSGERHGLEGAVSKRWLPARPLARTLPAEGARIIPEGTPACCPPFLLCHVGCRVPVRNAPGIILFVVSTSGRQRHRRIVTLKPAREWWGHRFLLGRLSCRYRSRFPDLSNRASLD